MGFQSVVLGDPVRLVSGRYSPDGRLLSYYSTFTPLRPETLKKFLRVLVRLKANVVLLPLPQRHYHQTHRETARLVLRVLYTLERRRHPKGWASPSTYFYSDNLADLFGAYGLKSNRVYFYGELEEERKQRLLTLIPSQLARNPHYPQQVRAKDLLIAGTEFARRPGLEGKGHFRDKPYAEHLLKVSMVPAL
jgi:LmbE family N-acetylglucosaminyl deacetylase